MLHNKVRPLRPLFLNYCIAANYVRQRQWKHTLLIISRHSFNLTYRFNIKPETVSDSPMNRLFVHKSIRRSFLVKTSITVVKICEIGEHRCRHLDFKFWVDYGYIAISVAVQMSSNILIWQWIQRGSKPEAEANYFVNKVLKRNNCFRTMFWMKIIE